MRSCASLRKLGDSLSHMTRVDGVDLDLLCIEVNVSCEMSTRRRRSERRLDADDTTRAASVAV